MSEKFNGTTATYNAATPISLEHLADMNREMREDFLAEVRAVAALHGVILMPSPMLSDNKIVVMVSQKTFDELRREQQ